MKRGAILFCLGAVLALAAGCDGAGAPSELPAATAVSDPAAENPAQGLSGANGESEEERDRKISLQIGGRDFTVRWEDNAAARALADRAAEEPVTVELRDYGGFEKVGALGESLPEENRRVTTRAGDIVLYNGDQIVLFYGSNSWSYTPLGRVEDLTGWEEALSGESATVTFAVPE